MSTNPNFPHASSGSQTGATADRAAKTGHSYVEDVAGHLHDAIDATKGKVQVAEERVRDLSQQAAKGTRVAQDEAQRYVKSNPMMAMGVAVATGAILGALLLRR